MTVFQCIEIDNSEHCDVTVKYSFRLIIPGHSSNVIQVHESTTILANDSWWHVVSVVGGLAKPNTFLIEPPEFRDLGQKCIGSLKGVLGHCTAASSRDRMEIVVV